ncbi:MAG TPA: glycosyltransferase [Chthoniobacterales bacterium]|jgi:rhamnopyranosyl-N-acetylglucosaminyl-diphospho-decaprenol beta-1,3/1,4-galactofuranosyltransferase|nr:glycosyltransferase [Chthoniobacterales bacterium]
MATDNYSIAAVMTVFNQVEGARRCVQSLLAQTASLARICVLFNGTAKNGALADAFAAEFHERPNVHVLRSPENIGNAGGVKLAMRAAMDLGADWIWIVEDDALPHHNALERLLVAGMKTDCVYGSLIIDPKWNDLAFSAAAIEQDGSQRIVSKREELPPANSFQVRGIWLGALVPRQIIDVVGEVNADLFIRGEDEEYPARIRQAGFRFFCVKDSVIEHPGMRNVHLAIAGVNFFYETGVAPWKAYFLIRNHVYVRRKYTSAGRVAGSVRAIGTIVLSILCALRFDDHKLKRSLLYLRAGWHGLLGRLDVRPAGTPA